MQIKNFLTDINSIREMEVGEVCTYHFGCLAIDRFAVPFLDELATQLMHMSTGQYFVGEKIRPNPGTGEYSLFQRKEGERYHYMARRIKKVPRLTVNGI